MLVYDPTCLYRSCIQYLKGEGGYFFHFEKLIAHPFCVEELVVIKHKKTICSAN